MQKDLKPLLVGQASKQRVTLIQAYVTQMKRFSDSSDSTIGILELIKSVIIDLIEGYSSSNTKLRAQAESVFGELLIY